MMSNGQQLNDIYRDSTSFIDYVQKLPSRLPELILNNCRQRQDLIEAGTGIQPYSFLDAMEATEEQHTFSSYSTNHTQVYPQRSQPPLSQPQATTFPEPMVLSAPRKEVRQLSWGQRTNDIPRQICYYRCQGFGHLANVCPSVDTREQFSANKYWLSGGRSAQSWFAGTGSHGGAVGMYGGRGKVFCYRDPGLRGGPTSCSSGRQRMYLLEDQEEEWDEMEGSEMPLSETFSNLQDTQWYNIGE
jgi:hypothetical protein